jgi:hypothetical protein
VSLLPPPSGRCTRTLVDSVDTRFERQVDPDGVLPDDERAETARHARVPNMVQLAERCPRRAAASTRPGSKTVAPRDPTVEIGAGQ